MGMAWYVAWPDGHGMVYGMAWRAWYEKNMVWPDDIWRYMVKLGGRHMV